jgi:hypothetical protein
VGLLSKKEGDGADAEGRGFGRADARAELALSSEQVRIGPQTGGRPRRGKVQFNNKVNKGFAERVDRHLLKLSAVMGRKLERADILELMLEAFEAAQRGDAGAEAFAAFA